MPHESLSARRRAITAADKSALFQREPPLHVLVNRWLAAGWEVDPELLEEAGRARTAERLSLKDPLPDREIWSLVRKLPREQHKYALWVWKKCANEPPEQLETLLNSMFMGVIYSHMVGAEEVLDALADVARWRMHYNDFEPDESCAWL